MEFLQVTVGKLIHIEGDMSAGTVQLRHFLEKFAGLTNEIGNTQTKYRVELSLVITWDLSVCMLQLLEIAKLLLE
jgi:hypothetical protein